MKKIHFYKYAANGNNFVVIDEIDKVLIPESDKATLAKMICNPATGIGCDTLIFIQRFSTSNLNGASVIGTTNPDYIMRVFEQNGFESDCCGNGLICLGHHLAIFHQVTQSAIATEIPSGQANPRTVSLISANRFQISMGEVVLPSNRLINLSAVSYKKIGDNGYLLDNVATIPRCYFTYSGTPHVVVFMCDNMVELETLFNDQAGYDATLITEIGMRFNRLNTIFPLGTNINFAKVIDDSHIVYRCFERGVYRETYACGTGATAVAAMTQTLSKCKNSRLSILPWYARRNNFYHHAEIQIEQQHANYSLTSDAHLLAHGIFHPL